MLSLIHIYTGKQPPCTEAVLASGVKRVIVGCTDPNPVVAGRGIRLLREKGLEVVAGVLRGECERRNEVFFHFMRTKLPFTVLKYAMTLDGKTATEVCIRDRDFIDAGVTKDFLKREWANAQAETVTPNCRMRCSGCGVRKYGGGRCV